MMRQSLKWLRKRFVLTLMLVLFAVATGTADETRVYVERTGNDSKSFTWHLQEGDEIVVTSREADALFVNRLHPDGRTRLWRHETPERRITVQRQGNRLELQGTRSGHPVKELWEIDDLPWYQPLSYSLRGFLRSDRDSVRFWMVRGDALKPIRMRAVKAGNETIDIAGEAVEAIKVRLEPDGLMSVLWHGHYWYRRSDGLFLHFEGSSGLHGGPLTVVQLQSTTPGDESS